MWGGGNILDLVDKGRIIKSLKDSGVNPLFLKIVERVIEHPALFAVDDFEGLSDDAKIQWLKSKEQEYLRARTRAVTLEDLKTSSDPAVAAILKQSFSIDDHSVQKIERNHRLAMQAENLLGYLLERYVASELEKVGWSWCPGDFLRAVDFIKLDDDLKLLQVKNRSNSENSSASKVRIGTKIQKWHRIQAMSGNTRWNKLPDIEAGKLTEEGFHRFIALTVSPRRRSRSKSSTS